MKPVILPKKNRIILDALEFFKKASQEDIAGNANQLRFYLKEVTG